MEDTRILMVVKEAEARSAYEEALRRAGVSFDVADSFNEVLRLSVENAYSGLIIDILTLIRSSKEEKLIAYDCLNFYPSLRVKWDPRQKAMNLSPLEQSFSADAQSTLDFFIESRCRSFAARSLRKFNRKDTVLALLLGTSPDCSEAESVKTFTVNVSQGGAFIQTIEPFAKGDPVWLRFRELPQGAPVQAVVCWQIQWGACRSIPGIGVRFEFASQEQAEEVRKLAQL